MHIVVEWQAPIKLTHNKKIIVDEKQLPDVVGEKPAVYFFSRKFGEYYLPFYIGETSNVRKRLKVHLQSKKIYQVLIGQSGDVNNIRNGTRYFHFGYLRLKPGMQKQTCLKIVQKYMIRQAVENDIPILNHNLKKIKSHRIRFDGGPVARGQYQISGFLEA